MTSRAALGRHTRPKKLNAKQSIQIFREGDVDPIDFDIRSTIETGVEKNEESEYHLQQAIKASQSAIAKKIEEAYIPTPPTIASNVQYDVLYPAVFQQPATYIRSSSTVEDCAGIPYSMDEEDEIALKKLNASPQSGFGECSEDHFEEVMNFFEDTAKNKQPFAAVDNPPVLPLEEIEEQYDEFTAVHIRKFAKPIYDHWKNRRISSNNHGLEPRLRFETGQDTDDADPYVCFRRRELRQTRKTRNRDAQSAEKLRRLRKELEDARQILQMVKQREVYRKEQIQTDKMLFIQRCEVKETKRKLDIKGDDEDLVNQKPKKKILAELSPGQQQLAPHLRIPIGRPDELRTLEDWQHERDKAIQREISLNTEKHVRWNEGYVDKTMAPLTPVTSTEIAFKHGFRPAMPETTMLPTPPASESAGSPPHDSADAGESSKAAALKPFPYASPIEDDSHLSMPSFRRRVGRGGRLLIDRRMPFRTKRDHADDRFRFDNSDSDEPEIEQDDDTDLFHSMMHRAYLFGKGRDAEAAAQVHRRSQIEMATSSSQPNGVMPNGTPMQRQAATPS